MTTGPRPFWLVNAFAGEGLQGNPAAIVECESWPSEEAMQATARETGAAATAFLVRDRGIQTKWQVRWFSKYRELGLCGHASMASAYVLLGREDIPKVIFQSQTGAMLEALSVDAGIEISIPAIETAPDEWPQAVAALGAQPIATYRFGKGYAVFVYESEQQIRELEPDFVDLAKLGDGQFICTAPGENSDIVSRVFTPGAGALEDTATGSAHAVMAPIWANHLGRGNFSAVQASERGGRMFCRLDGGNVALTGACETVVEGRIYLSG